METEFMVTLLGLAGSALGSLCGVLINTKLSNYRIEQLEKKVDKHNSLIERVYELEKKQRVTDEKMTVANHRITDLEKGE